MPSIPLRVSCALLAAWSGMPAIAAAQPAPTFSATCGELREKAAALGSGEDRLVVIDVVGELTIVDFDGVIAYMGMCGAPDPQVVCITYSTNDYKPGDRVVLSGAFQRLDAETVRLDPCLHYPPESPQDDE